MTRLSRAIPLLLTGVSFLFACGEGGAEPRDEGIEREAFVATYVDLRRAALRNGGALIAPPERERVLADHGVTAGDLLEFIEIHGEDLEYMRSVWDSVEARLEQEAFREGSPAPPGAPVPDSLR